MSDYLSATERKAIAQDAPPREAINKLLAHADAAERIIRNAQTILAASLDHPPRPSDKETIQALLELLDGPDAVKAGASG